MIERYDNEVHCTGKYGYKMRFWDTSKTDAEYEEITRMFEYIENFQAIHHCSFDYAQQKYFEWREVFGGKDRHHNNVLQQSKTAVRSFSLFLSHKALRVRHVLVSVVRQRFCLLNTGVSRPLDEYLDRSDKSCICV